MMVAIILASRGGKSTRLTATTNSALLPKPDCDHGVQEGFWEERPENLTYSVADKVSCLKWGR